jgi:hypothetical protein
MTLFMGYRIDFRTVEPSYGAFVAHELRQAAKQISKAKLKRSLQKAIL